jgi:cholesterol transport system auxiliary component
MGLKLILGSIVLLGLGACKSIKLPENQQYQLTQFSCQKHQTPHGESSLFVSPPEALRGYDGIKMNYSTQPYEVKAFVHHAWLGSPTQMIHPLLTQSLQCSNYFKAVSSGIYSDKTDYRLDSQLLMLQQNFTSSPSQVELVMKLVLNDVKNNTVITSKIFHYQQNCPTDTPYGGVLAANAVVKQFTHDAVNFVGKNIH